MKISQRMIRKMILSEIRNLQETREDHISGIRSKIIALETELRRQKAAHPLYNGKSEYYSDFSYFDELLGHIGNIQDKIARLKEELARLEAIS